MKKKNEDFYEAISRILGYAEEYTEQYGNSDPIDRIVSECQNWLSQYGEELHRKLSKQKKPQK